MFLFQSVAAAACFFYASHVGLYAQLGILLFLSIAGTISFVAVEWAVKKEAKKAVTDGTESDTISEP